MIEREIVIKGLLGREINSFYLILPGKWITKDSEDINYIKRD